MEVDYSSSEESSCAAEVTFYFLQDLKENLERERQEKEIREQEIRKEREEKVFDYTVKNMKKIQKYGRVVLFERKQNTTFFWGHYKIFNNGYYMYKQIFKNI